MELPAPIDAPERSAAEGAMRRALLGAFLFAGGSVITAASYYFAPPSGVYLIATGIIAVGAWQLFQGLWEWRRTPREDAPPGEALVPVALALVGALALGSIGVSEYLGRVETAAWESWDAALDEHDRLLTDAGRIADGFYAREGLSQQDIDDARKMADLFDEANRKLEAVNALPAGVEQYRAKMLRAGHGIAEGFRRYAEGGTSQSEADAARHLARVETFSDDLSSAFDEYDAWLDEMETAAQEPWTWPSLPDFGS